MKAHILNGIVHDTPTTERVSRRVRQALESRFDVTEDHLASLPLTFCHGCFGCYVVTPGACVRRDEAARCASRAIASHLIVALSPITFGGLSSPLKKAMDRIIGIMMPEFRKMGLYSHHLARYQQVPSLLGVGFCDERRPGWERTFAAYFDRLSVDLHASMGAAVTFCEGDDIACLADRVDQTIAKMGVAG